MALILRSAIAVDLAKFVFAIVVSRHPGKVAERHRLPREACLRSFAERRPATVLLEACGSAHHWARQIEALGHRVLLLPPHKTRRDSDALTHYAETTVACSSTVCVAFSCLCAGDRSACQ